MAEEFDARDEALVRTPRRDKRARGMWAHHLRMCRAAREEAADRRRRDAEAVRALDAMPLIVVAVDCPILPAPEPRPDGPCGDCGYVAKRCRC